MFRYSLSLPNVIVVDIVGPFETGPIDCKFAITTVDYYSKWPDVCFAQQGTTATVIRIMNTVFSQKGNPITIVTDNGPHFPSTEGNIQHISTTLYHPEGNGQ